VVLKREYLWFTVGSDSFKYAKISLYVNVQEIKRFFLYAASTILRKQYVKKIIFLNLKEKKKQLLKQWKNLICLQWQGPLPLYLLFYVLFLFGFNDFYQIPNRTRKYHLIYINGSHFQVKNVISNLINLSTSFVSFVSFFFVF